MKNYKMIYALLDYIAIKPKYKKLCHSLIEQFNGQIPQTHKELESLAGVGRKTANVVMSVAFGEPSLAVDTHVERVSKRLGINRWKDSVRQVEDRLCDIIPRDRWNKSHHQLIFLGDIIVLLENLNVRYVRC